MQTREGLKGVGALVRQITRLSLLAAERQRSGNADAALPPELAHRPGVMAELASRVQWNSPPGQFALHHLITCQPWPAVAAGGPHAAVGADAGLRLVRDLGALFDTTSASTRFLRSLSNTWSGWSVRHFGAIVDAWQAACAPLNPITDAMGPHPDIP